MKDGRLERSDTSIPSIITNNLPLVALLVAPSSVLSKVTSDPSMPSPSTQTAGVTPVGQRMVTFAYTSSTSHT